MGELAILGLKNKGGFQNLSDSGGTFWFAGGYIFQGSLDFEEEKALFWHWTVPIFKKKSPAEGHLTLLQ